MLAVERDVAVNAAARRHQQLPHRRIGGRGDVEDAGIGGSSSDRVTHRRRRLDDRYQASPGAAEFRECRRRDALPVEDTQARRDRCGETLEGPGCPRHRAGPIRRATGLFEEKSRHQSLRGEAPMTRQIVQPERLEANPETARAEVIVEGQESAPLSAPLIVTSQSPNGEFLAPTVIVAVGEVFVMPNASVARAVMA